MVTIEEMRGLASTGWERVALPFTGFSAATFAALSALCGNRIFHPVGEAFVGRLELHRAAVDFGLDIPADGNHRAIVRFSRGAGVPEPLPDVLGLAIKFHSGERLLP